MLRELLNRMYGYVIARSTLSDLETWLLSNLQQILDSGDDEAIEVANHLDADLVQLGEGLIDEATFRQRLEAHVRACDTALVSFGEPQQRATTHIGSASQTVTPLPMVVASVWVDHLTWQPA